MFGKRFRYARLRPFKQCRLFFSRCFTNTKRSRGRLLNLLPTSCLVRRLRRAASCFILQYKDHCQHQFKAPMELDHVGITPKPSTHAIPLNTSYMKVASFSLSILQLLTKDHLFASPTICSFPHTCSNRLDYHC